MASKFPLKISINDIHNDLISESSIYQSKEGIDEKSGKLLISNTGLCELMTSNVRKISNRYKQKEKKKAERVKMRMIKNEN